MKIWKIKTNDYECIDTIQGHTRGIAKAIPITGERIASCSSDKTIKIWNNYSPYDCLATLKGHTKEVYSILQLKDGRLISGSSDRKLLFWDLSDYKLDEEHKVSSVYCGCWNNLYEVSNKRVIVGGTEVICVVNCANYTVEEKIKSELFAGATFWSLCPMNDGGILGGLSNGDIVKISNDYQSIERIAGAHPKGINDIVLISDFLFCSCGDDGDIKVWKY